LNFNILIMKKYLFGILAITMAVGFSAFTTKNSAKKPFATTDFFYVPGVYYQRLQANHTTESDLKERSLNEVKFKDVEDWRTSAVSYTSTSDMSKYIGKITFDLDNVADGSSDHALTLAEALVEIWAAYTAPAGDDVMPATVNVNSGDLTITIEAKTAVN